MLLLIGLMLESKGSGFRGFYGREWYVFGVCSFAFLWIEW